MDLFKQLLRFSVSNNGQKLHLKAGQLAQLQSESGSHNIEELGVIQPQFVLQVLSQLFGPKTELLNQGKPVHGIMDLVGLGEVKTIGLLMPSPSVLLFFPSGHKLFDADWQSVSPGIAPQNNPAVPPQANPAVPPPPPANAPMTPANLAADSEAAAPDLSAPPVPAAPSIPAAVPASAQQAAITPPPIPTGEVAQPQNSAAPAGLSAAPQNLSAAPQNLSAAPQNLSAVPQELSSNAAATEQIADVPPQPEENVSATPNDLSAAPSNLSAAPQNLSAAPQNLSAAPQNLSAAPQNLSAAPTLGEVSNTPSSDDLSSQAEVPPMAESEAVASPPQIPVPDLGAPPQNYEASEEEEKKSAILAADLPPQPEAKEGLGTFEIPDATENEPVAPSPVTARIEESIVSNDEPGPISHFPNEPSQVIEMPNIRSAAPQDAPGQSQAKTTPASSGPMSIEFGVPATEMGAETRSPALDNILTDMLKREASDLHLTVGEPIVFRQDGDVVKDTSKPNVTAQQMKDLLLPIMPNKNKEELSQTNDTDFAYEIPGLARFRVNIFRDRNGICSVMRHIPQEIMTARELRLNPTILNFCQLHKGLVLVTGPTGSGKSTTLAAMIDHINKTRSSHILTIEDPIEFVYKSDRCLIHQREVGRHTKSFAKALRAALREDPDIVLVGEMRDLETIKIAIETAETGHLVFGTLHTNTAISTVDRIVDQFPADQQDQIRVMLSEGLKGVVSQNLLKRREKGRCAVQEIMVVNRALSAIIREGKTHMLANQMTSSRQEGNILLNEALLSLVVHKEVTAKEAYLKAVDKSEFTTMLQAKGIPLEDPEEEAAS